MVDFARPKFSLGQVVATPAALEALEKAAQEPEEFLRRHVTGDWGDLCAEDRASNDAALDDGSRILSAFVLNNGTRIWIITEATNDQGRRLSTTILLPEEY